MDGPSSELKRFLESGLLLRAEAEGTLRRLEESLRLRAEHSWQTAAREQKARAEKTPCKEAALLDTLCPFLSPKEAAAAKRLTRALRLWTACRQTEEGLRACETDLVTAEAADDALFLQALLFCALWQEEG